MFVNVSGWMIKKIKNTKLVIASCNNNGVVYDQLNKISFDLWVRRKRSKLSNKFKSFIWT